MVEKGMKGICHQSTKIVEIHTGKGLFYLDQMPKKGAKVLPPGLWELIFEDASLL